MTHLRRTARKLARAAYFAVAIYGSLLGVAIGYKAAETFLFEWRLGRNARRADRYWRDNFHINDGISGGDHG